MDWRYSDDELDVLMYIVSYIAAYSVAPTQKELLEKGLEPRVVKGLITRGCLAEMGGRIWHREGSLSKDLISSSATA